MSSEPLNGILDDLRIGLRRRHIRRRIRNAAATGVVVAAMAAAALAGAPQQLGGHATGALASGSVGQTDATVVLLDGCRSGDNLACLSPLQN